MTNSSAKAVYFDKYDQRGAYHWQECNVRSMNYNPPLVARYEVVRREVEVASQRDRVLDIGCGDAYLIAQIQSICTEVRGVDSESQAVALANQILGEYGHCSVVQGDCYQLPFDDGYFDMVLCTDVIEHLKDPHSCIKEIRRVLNDNGTLVMTTPKFRPDRKWDDRHEQEFTSQELGCMLREHFVDVKISYFWPLRWSNFYHTRIGWRVCKYIGKLGWNPFLSETQTHPDAFGQIKAVCSGRGVKL
jgi:ubiquinone/menaquinone biosynthesis C-methylase UbiE